MGMRFYILILSFLVSMGSSAQEKISFAELDKVTYDLFRKADWKQLKNLGEKGLKAGYDYYYLRMRLGVSYYELKRYERATSHFRKALEFSDDDPAALEYLYYSLLLSGRNAESRLVAARMPETTRKSIGLPGDKGLTAVFIEGGNVMARQPDSLVSFRPSGPYVYNYLIKDYLYLAAGISKNTGPRLNITASVNHLRFNAMQEGTIKDPAVPFPQFFEWDHQNSQSGIYLASEYLIDPGWILGLSGHIIGGNFNYMRYNNRRGMGQDLFTEWDLTYSDYVFNGQITRRIGAFEAVLTASLSDLGNTMRFQPGIGLNWYPLGNVNLYLQTQVDRIMPLPEGIEGDWVFQGLAGMKVFPKLWIEANVGAGRMAGWSEKSAYIVYNNQDAIIRRGGINLIIPGIISGLSLTLRYQTQEREHSWQIYNGDELLEAPTKEYLSNSLIGGITWKF